MSPEPCWITSPAGAVLQGELLFGVIEVQVEIASIGTPDVAVREIVHPLALVVSQDCDLDLDYKARTQGGAAHRLVDNVLLCDVDDAIEMRNRGGLSNARWRLVETFQNERYHVLQGLFGRMLGLDFRRVFTIPTAELYRRVEIGEATRLCFLSTLHRYHLSNRFYGYHMRVALEEEAE